MRIVITAGHGGKDPGAVADYDKDGNAEYTESTFCADMRNYVAYYLRNRGYRVETDGQGPTNAPLSQAIVLAQGADIAIEFHLNAAVSPSAEGIEVLANPRHKLLAQKIARAIRDVTGSPLRGDGGFKVESSGQHSRLGFVRAGGLVVELEFVSNKARMQVLNDKRWLVAKSIAEAIMNHIGGK